MNNENKSVVMEVKYSDFKVLNPDFTRCRCNVFYTGRNRNYSDITPDALQKLIARKGYANVPVIGHIRSENVMGGHDRKIEISDEGIDIINQCVPYGVIPEDCNPTMDKIIDIHGEEKEYFSVDVILWTSYFPEIMETVGDPNVLFSQSMEISLLDYSYDGDYTVINDFSLQALCLLGRYNDERRDQSTEPAFEDSTVHRFSIDESQFKQNFELMLEKLKSYESGDKSVQDKDKNFEKEEKTVMNRESLLEALKAFTYENTVGETVTRYALVDANEISVGLIDRQDNKVYSVKFAESEDGAIVFDFENAVECSFTTKEKVEDDFDYAGEIIVANETSAKVKENEFSTRIADAMKKEMDKFNAQIDELSNAYEDLKKQYEIASDKLAQYEAADAQRKAEQHEADVEALYEKFAKKINRVPEFLCYRADRKNVEKDIETIEAELTVIAGKAAMNKAQSFSYTPTVSGVKEFEERDTLAYTDRYGNLFAKFTK